MFIARLTEYDAYVQDDVSCYIELDATDFDEAIEMLRHTLTKDALRADPGEIESYLEVGRVTLFWISSTLHYNKSLDLRDKLSELKARI